MPQGEALSAEDVLAVGQRLETALAQTAHAGLRRVTSEYVATSGRHLLVYDEHIVTDGRGNFALDPVQVLEGAGTDFLVLQKARVGMTFLYRDFRVRDLELFRENFVVLASDADTFVAGRDCSEFHAYRPGTDRVYTVAMDRATGIVLRYAEATLDGEPISAMEYLTFEENPDLGGVAFHRPRIEQELVSYERLLESSDTLLGFEPLIPTWLPAGYALSNVAVVLDPQGLGKWARFTYTDGVDSLFFLHGGPDPDAAPAASQEPGAGPEQAGGPAAPGREGDIQIYEIAPLSLLQGTIGDERVIVVGKLDDDTLLRLLESAI